MIERLPLFDSLFAGKPTPPKRRLTGEDLKRSGMESVLSKTPGGYVEKFMQAIESFPRGHSFTVEQVRDIAGEPPIEAHKNCLGALTRAAAKRGLMRATETYVKAKRPSLHSRKIQLWVRN